MNRRAVTIIEVMVAMFILLVAGGAILMGLMLSLSQGKQSQERVLAQIIAGSVIDELKAHPYGSTQPLAGWKADGQSFTREQTVATIVGGLPSPIAYEMKVTPVDSSQKGIAQVQVRIDWQETSGPTHMEFKVAMPEGWNQAVNRGSQPAKVAANWHDPKAYTIPSEPSYIEGSKDHTVNSDPPDAGSIINNDTQQYQGLYNQLTQAKVQLDTDQQAVSSDQQQIASVQSQLKAEKAKKNPDQSTIDSLETQLSGLQTKLSQDQAKVQQDQKTIAGIQAQIDALNKSSSNGSSSGG